ncbi:GNAT family N-acetyltransferase [Rhodococcus sp. IEGM 1370]|uniref:GNAT family N-acetyltransferase n=1 Tax=Rhodococcus sp. IEGM 1370 TaxID=3082222 RepID=UPI00263625DD|nr:MULTISPECIES: GNAT family N-acetyltransferase [unclassified Rhodococcus (in: high G+C Gram-positive bacteria)]MDI6628527.1 GNAT family N-acetyltransferase [Rhodococcus sp. (in: high G+C Gram-positive bacteria)]MDV8078406.1 GNAT family N-acetyltransferase [Rhodococcus sp. IEGM 1370]
MPVKITHDTVDHRFEIHVDSELAGYSEYLESDGSRTFHHTVTLPQFRGRGLAAALTEYALDDTSTQGLRVVPACWFVRDFIAAAGDRYSHLTVP